MRAAFKDKTYPPQSQFERDEAGARIKAGLIESRKTSCPFSTPEDCGMVLAEEAAKSG